MVDAVVSFTIGKLNDFVTKQVNIRIGVKDGIEWLKDELGYLLISVRAAEAHQDKDHIRRWTDSVREVANQAVFIVERFSAHQEEHAAPEQGGVLDRMRGFICVCKKEANLYDIGKDIESLKEKIIGIKSRRDEYRINDMINANVQQRKRTLLRATSFDHEVDVVGFEDDVRTLLGQLGNGNPSLNLVSIHGMGGLGKSTLASKLYHSRELSHFKTRAWVCVSEDYDITHVLKKLIKSFNEHEKDLLLNEMDEVALLRYLRKILLEGDHFLVVIDDIWDLEVWKKIQNAFPDKKNCSRVIITTRNKMVAQGVNDTCFIHELRFLRKEESWELFCRRAKPTPNLKELGEQMVDKCGGLPLAIVILSGLLLQRKTYTFWSDVKNNIWRKLKGKSSEIRELLNLSYDDLSSQLRKCFLYLARFPEDFIFEVFELKLLWIAEEFVTEADEEDGVDMEDVAEDYLNELMNRNMIQIQSHSVEGQAFACRVHDLVRDLAIEKAIEEKVLGIFDSSKHHPNPIRLLQGQARHAINNGIGEYLKIFTPKPADMNLRSLVLTTNTGTFELEVKEMKLMCFRYKYLKVLDLTSVAVESKGIPEEIGDLIFLKFLGLMGVIDGGDKKVLSIPSSIGKLKKLQTFCGPKSYSSKYEFPEEICELKKLRHFNFLKISGSLNISSHQTKLQTLRFIPYKDWLKIDSISLTNLHTLAIETFQIGVYSHSLESIAKLKSLQTLSLYFGTSKITTITPLLYCKHLKRVLLMGKIKNLEELSFLPRSVVDLKLINSEFTADPMLTLGGLPNLISLCLDRGVYTGNKMVCTADAFPCLQYLTLNDTWGPKEFQVDDGALPYLKAFQISSFNRRFQMDKTPRRITSLPAIPPSLRLS